jgi:DNA-binding winged helix-turn-helix (wHTH) protein
MDQMIPRILSFEQFELDFARGCVRVGGRDVDLRPKAFDVLCHLAENAGRLVSKQELHDAVWGHIAVSDDALVQCIRELRQKLGDADRALIRTVPRRGYLLNANAGPGEVDAGSPAGTDATPESGGEVPTAATTPPLTAAASGTAPTSACPWYRGEPGRWAAALLVAAMALGSIPLARVVCPAPKDLVSVADAQQLAKLAADKQLPIPRFHITSLAEDVPDEIRRFVGVWVSDTGWAYSDRQCMLIVTGVTQRGEVSGFFVNGPSTRHSRVQGPAFVLPFKGYINGGMLRYDGYVGMYLGDVNRDGNMEFKLIHKDGVTSAARLRPVWTLPKGRTESAARAGDGISTVALNSR